MQPLAWVSGSSNQQPDNWNPERFRGLPLGLPSKREKTPNPEKKDYGSNLRGHQHLPAIASERYNWLKSWLQKTTILTWNFQLKLSGSFIHDQTS
jgi:hypothetical protein